ncbi:MAG: MFS transporter [Opitutus sp.]|nr:MFS transporter [Opitutus sp.]
MCAAQRLQRTGGTHARRLGRFHRISSETVHSGKLERVPPSRHEKGVSVHPAPPAPDDLPARDAYAALRHAPYRRYLAGNLLANIGRQAVSIAATWQIYQWTNSATALGLVGLVNVIPLLLFVLSAGALADRIDRRVIIVRCMAAVAALSLALALVSAFHARIPDHPVLQAANRGLHAIALTFERHVDPASLRFDNPALPIVYLLLFLHAIVRVIGAPARGSIVPLLVPSSALSNAITWSSSTFELSTVLGPAMGGAIVAVAGFEIVYALDVLFALSLVVALLGVRMPPRRGTPSAAPRPGTLEGARFIRRHQPLLAALTLDLFAVILGGAIILLPIYADKILHVGPAGLGWLRAAPALGAICMAFFVAHSRPFRRPGLVILWSVAGFGAATIAFGLSTSFLFSLLALFLSGAFDNISVVVRHSVVQLMTPDHLRGRVTSVNQLFIGSSNEISALRAGLVAALVGPVLATTLGGLGTILVTGAVALIWPSLKTLPPLHQLQPEPDGPPSNKNG